VVTPVWAEGARAGDRNPVKIDPGDELGGAECRRARGKSPGLTRRHGLVSWCCDPLTLTTTACTTSPSFLPPASSRAVQVLLASFAPSPFVYCFHTASCRLSTILPPSALAPDLLFPRDGRHHSVIYPRRRPVAGALFCTRSRALQYFTAMSLREWTLSTPLLLRCFKRLCARGSSMSVQVTGRGRACTISGTRSASWVRLFGEPTPCTVRGLIANWEGGGVRAYGAEGWIWRGQPAFRPSTMSP
jgi:hypothetical protein